MRQSTALRSELAHGLVSLSGTRKVAPERSVLLVLDRVE
jgi:hypothetical protein